MARPPYRSVPGGASAATRTPTVCAPVPARREPPAPGPFRPGSETAADAVGAARSAGAGVALAVGVGSADAVGVAVGSAAALVVTRKDGAVTGAPSTAMSGA